MRHRTATIPAAALLALVCACAPSDLSEPVATRAAIGDHGGPGAGGAERPDRILHLVLRLTANGVETVSAIEAPGRVNRRDPHRSSSTFFRALDRNGRVLFERGLRLETHLRSEVQGADGTLDGRRVPLEEPVFTVVVPRYPDLDAIRFFHGAPGALRDTAEQIGEVRP